MKGGAIIAILALLLVSCTQLPPMPPPPGVAGGVGAAAGGAAYADAEDKFYIHPQEFFLNVDEEQPLESWVQNQDLVYKHGYFWTGGEWKRFSYDGDPIEDTVWLRQGAFVRYPITLAGFEEGAHFILAYGCNKIRGGWDCNGNKWMLRKFVVRSKTTLPITPGRPPEEGTCCVKPTGVPAFYSPISEEDCYDHARQANLDVQFIQSLQDDVCIGFRVCSDSDDGKNYYEKGETKGVSADGLPVTKKDECIDGSTLGEWYCYPDDNHVEGMPYDCPEGCEDGACKRTVSLPQPTQPGYTTRINLLKTKDGYETISDAKETLTERDWAPLKSGYYYFEGDRYDYNQYIRNYPGKIIYGENDQDVLGHYLVYDDNEPIFEYELEFEEGFESKIKGDDLVDFEGTKLELLGEKFIVSETKYDKNTNALKIQLMNGREEMTIPENGAINYVYDNVEYFIRAENIDYDQNEGVVKLKIGDELTDDLTDGDIDTMASGLSVGITDIDYDNNKVQLFVEPKVIEFTDDIITDRDYTEGKTQYNYETLEDTETKIQADLQPELVELKLVSYRLKADGILDVFTPKGKGVKSQLAEPEGFLTDWDIIFESFDDNKAVVKVQYGKDPVIFAFDVVRPLTVAKVPGTKKLQFTNKNGLNYNLNIAIEDEIYIVRNNMKSTLHFVETRPTSAGIDKGDYFITSSPPVDPEFTHIYQYLGYDENTRMLDFEDVSTGRRMPPLEYDKNERTYFVVAGAEHLVVIDGLGNLHVDVNADKRFTNVVVDIITNRGVITEDAIRGDAWTGLPQSDLHQTCYNQGGKVVRGMHAIEQCSLPTNDAGNYCNDGKDCQGNICLADETNTGKCVGWTINFGCFDVWHNVNRGGICID